LIVIDTGIFVGAAMQNDKHHKSSMELLTALRWANEKLIVPGTVVAEAGYLINMGAGSIAEAEFLQSLSGKDFVQEVLTRTDLNRMAQLVTQYSDMNLGTTDASVVAIAERLGVTKIATIDRRHFPVIRPKHVDAFTLLPEVL